MAYHLDPQKISLDDLRKRIQATDLIPSRISLLDGIQEKFSSLVNQGICTIGDLRDTVKNNKRLEALGEATGIDPQYLTLLRREVEGYFPKPFALREIDWLPKEEIAKLEQIGVKDSAALYQAVRGEQGTSDLAQSSGVNPGVLEALLRLADLGRIQWVSPTTARMLVEADYTSSSRVAAANPEDLYEALIQVNAGFRFFKGTIGLRDVKRLVAAASFVG
jgi:hypothetical protein